jgi:hypothetical protein
MAHYPNAQSRVDDQIGQLNYYRKMILEVIREGDAQQSSAQAEYWLKKICDAGCDVKFKHDTSVKILEDLAHSIKLKVSNLHNLYTDTSFYV